MLFATIHVTRCCGGISAEFSSLSVRPYNFADRDLNDASVSRNVHFSIAARSGMSLNQVGGKSETIKALNRVW